MGNALEQLVEANNINIARLLKLREIKSMSEDANASGPQKLQACETCAAYLSKTDNDRRLADHFAGRVSILKLNTV